MSEKEKRLVSPFGVINHLNEWRSHERRKREIIKSFQGQDILSAGQFDQESLGVLFERADEMERIVLKGKSNDSLKPYILATLFYEPSTRTRLSFEAAMHRLGGKVISESSVQFSSVIKGERLEDTVRTVECYADIIALRQPRVGGQRLPRILLLSRLLTPGMGKANIPLKPF